MVSRHLDTRTRLDLVEREVHGSGVLQRLDEMIAQRLFANRSRAIELAVQEELDRLGRSRLTRECAKLVAAQEQRLAEEGMETLAWPEY